MIDVLYSIDRDLLLFINRTLANPVGDFLWPFITDWDKQWPVRVMLIAIWTWLIIWGGQRGRTVALLLIPLIAFSDQLNNHFLKEMFHRLRPCHLAGGVPVVPEVHLLVGCGGGMSFPSSHAVNNFAAATLLGWYYRRGWPWFFGWATIVALSRPAVGVHYPSDILAGAILGILIGLVTIWLWTKVQRRYFPRWTPNAIPESTA